MTEAEYRKLQKKAIPLSKKDCEQLRKSYSKKTIARPTAPKSKSGTSPQKRTDFGMQTARQSAENMINKQKSGLVMTRKEAEMRKTSAELTNNPQWYANNYTVKELQKMEYEARKKGNQQNVGAKRTSGSVRNDMSEQANQYTLKADMFKKARELRTSADDRQMAEYYSNVKYNTDYAKNSGYVSKVEKTYNDGISAKNTDIKKYQNSNRFTKGKLGEELHSTDNAAKYWINRMTDEEIDNYNYIYNTQGKDRAEDYLKFLERELNKRQADYEKSATEKYARQHPFDATAAAILSMPVRAVGGVAGTVSQKIENNRTGRTDGIDVNSDAFDLERMKEDNIGAVTENMGEAGKFFYNTGVSMGENLVMLPFGGKIALATMAGSAFSNTAYDATKRGATVDQATNLGLASAITEIATEKIGIERLFNVAEKGGIESVKELLVSASKQGGIEGCEELISEIANNIFDYAIMGDKSNYSLSVENYKKNGATESDAKKRALEDIAKNVVFSFLGGAVSGGIMGLGAGSINLAGNKAKARENTSPPSTEGNTTIETNESTSVDLPPSTEAKAAAAKQIQEETSFDLNDGKMSSDTGIELDKPVENYPYNTQKVIKEYTDYSNGKIRNFVNRVISGKASTKERILLNPIKARAVRDIKRILGVDVSNYNIAIDRNAVEHIEKRHGQNGSADSSMADIADIERLQWVLDNYDNVEYGGRSTAYTTIKENGKTRLADTVLYSKKIDGTYYVVEAVPITKNKTLRVVSAYINKKGASQVPDVPTPEVTSETPSANTPNKSIAESDAVVNNYNNPYIDKNGLQYGEGNDIINTKGGVENGQRNDGTGSEQRRNINQSSGEQSSSLWRYNDIAERSASADARRGTGERVQRKGKGGETVSYERITVDSSQKSKHHSLLEEQANRLGAKIEYGLDITVDTANGKTKKAFALVQGNTIVVAYDAPINSGVEELAHRIRSVDEGKYNSLFNSIIGNISNEAYSDLFKRAVGAYGDVYNTGGKVNADAITEEMVCNLASVIKTGTDEVSGFFENYEVVASAVDDYFESEISSSKVERSNVKRALDNTPKKFIKSVSEFIPMPKTAKGSIKRSISSAAESQIADIRLEYLKTGKVNREKADNLFGFLYESAVVENVEKYDEALDYIRNTKLYISPADKSNISDFNKFRQSMFRRLDITTDGSKGGLPVDVAFAEFNEMFPGLVDSEITHPADRLQALADFAANAKESQRLSIDEYFGSGAENIRSQMQEMFNDSLEEFLNGGGEEIKYSVGTGKRSNRKNWTPDLPKKSLETLKKIIKRDIETSRETITDTANWLMTRINGESVFAIYSTENKADPTLLYESRGRQAIIERDALLDTMEVEENGESIIGNPDYAGKISEADRFRYFDDIRSNTENLGRGRNNRDGGVLQKKPSANPSTAFRSVVKNIFEIQKEKEINANDTETPDIRYSIDETDEFQEVHNKYSELLKRYGNIERGEKPSVNYNVPRKSENGKLVNKHARTIAESGFIKGKKLTGEFEKAVTEGRMSHEVITDKAAQSRAEAKIKEVGFDEAYRDWQSLAKQGRLNKDDIAVGQLLFNTAATNKDAEKATKIACDLALIESVSAQNLQAARMLKKMGPEGQLYYAEKTVMKINRELLDYYKDKFGEGKKHQPIKIDESLASELLNAKTNEERDAAVDRIQQNIADQIPSTTGEKWTSWRYLSMLGNLRTHGRNILGNTFFVPARVAKNVFGTAIERAIPKEKRTKAVFTSKDARDFAKQDWLEMMDIVRGDEGKYNNIRQGVESKRTIYKKAWILEKLRKANLYALEAEDSWFLGLAYKSSLAQAITARGYTAEFLNSGTAEANQKLKEIQNYAISEAQKATYRDASQLSDWLNKSQRNLYKNKKLKPFGFMVDGVLPFKKTPVNVLRRGIDYSPIGVIKGICRAFGKVRNGKSTAAEAIDEIASGLIGTGICALGAYLRTIGIIATSADDDENLQEYQKEMGKQNYSLVIGDKSYTIDWLAPVSLPLFVGVAAADAFKETHKNPLTAVLDSLSNISEPMFELSCLSGVQDAIKNVKYENGNEVTAVAFGALSSYLQQALPTLSGQLARTFDPIMRNAHYNDKNSDIPKYINDFIKQTMTKIPGVINKLPEKVDRWGNTRTYEGNTLGRMFQNTISPGYFKTYSPTYTDREIIRLYESTGNSSVIPGDFEKSFDVDGVRKYLTEDEYVKYSKKCGKEAYKYTTELFRSDYYKRLDDATKAEAVQLIYEYATHLARAEVSNYKLDSNDLKVQSAPKDLISPAQYFVAKRVISPIESDKDKNGNTVTYSRAVKQAKALRKIYPTMSKEKFNKLLTYLDFTENQIYVINGITPPKRKKKK